VQGEITLHNLYGHNSAIDLFACGMAGLLGTVLARFEQLRKITPPPVMLSWFVAITLAGGIDAFTDQSQVDRLPIYIIAWMGEVTEMLIGMASLLFVTLKRQELAVAWRQAAGGRGRGA
jgi:hypothetical protein